ncbi:MAG: cyclic nucleotide-binding domain-containing protein [Gammaproteobacteria bacterium]
MKTLDVVIAEHPFFSGFDPAHTALIAGCGRIAAYKPGEFLFQAGLPANDFFLLRRGTVALELEVPGRGPFRFGTATAGEVIGWSWLFPPHEWQFDARAVDDVGVVRFDGTCLRGKCEADPVLGYAVMKAFAGVLVDRFLDTRLQLVDVYGRRD